MKKVLLIEDDLTVSLETKSYLDIYGFKTSIIKNAQEAKHIFNNQEIEELDIILLDLVLPDIKGYELCKLIRNTPNLNKVPILMLTGNIDISSKYICYEAGADDYLTKPFEGLELILKINSLTRRYSSSKLKEDSTAKIKSDLVINNKTVRLTPNEYNILMFFYKNPNKNFSAEDILTKVLDYPKGTGNPEIVRTHINNLRSKLEKDKTQPEIITNIPRKGYQLNKSKIMIS